jgi:hypothetical protein
VGDDLGEIGVSRGTNIKINIEKIRYEIVN